jgi:muconolactone delta-isomerase
VTALVIMAVERTKPMRFLVEVAFKKPPTPEILALIPAEIAHGKTFDERGLREALYVAGDDSRAWQIYRVHNRKELEAIIESFPLTPHMAVNITEIHEPQA